MAGETGALKIDYIRAFSSNSTVPAVALQTVSSPDGGGYDFYGATTPPATNDLVLNVSEDAWQGNAQFVVTVDGAQVGGTYTATASHAAGQTQAVDIGALSAGAHEVGVTFINDASGGSASTDRNLFLNSATLNGQTITGATAGLYVDGTSEFSTTSTAATGFMSLYMAEDASQGDAQFTVSVDGQQLGGVFTVTASHGAGQTEKFNFSGIPEAASHDVAITFLNGAAAGAASNGRNLYVSAIQFDGQNVPSSTAALTSDGTKHFTAAGTASGGGGTTTTPATNDLVLNVSEDAWQGNAQFVVTVDGAQVGGTYTATASHAAGQTQAVDIGALSAGAHEVGVTFINDASGGSASTNRNLFLNSATLNGQTITGATAGLYVDGTSEFSTTSTAATGFMSLYMAEDASQGDAQFTVSVDGQQLGGVFTVTASHGAGQTEKFNFSGIPEAASHDVAITFLNGAAAGAASNGRNLYVSLIQFDGQNVPSSTAALYSDGTHHF